MEIPFHKAYITGDEVLEVTDTLRSGWLTMGPKTMRFENEFRDYVGARCAVAVNSCTAALHLALEAVGLAEGDEVILPAMTFTATIEVVCYFRAVPVLADVDRETLNISVADVERKITPRTKVIIPVDYGGQPADLDEITALAAKRGIFVIEDAAHTLPSSYRGRRVGTLSDITCFSCYATKTLAMGEGGLITTENEQWADRMKVMRLHGMSRDAWKRYGNRGNWFYEVVDAGYKYNTTDLHAAIGLAQLRKLEMMGEKRAAVAAAYTRAFSGVPGIAAPAVKPDRTTSWHLYVLRVDPGTTVSRDAFIRELGERGVGTSVHFIPLYRHAYYRKKFAFRAADFPDTEWAYARILSLPIYPSLENNEVAAVIDAVTAVAALRRR